MDGKKIFEKLKTFFTENLVIIFFLLVIIILGVGMIFSYLLNNPDNNNINDIVHKFSTKDYSLP